MIFPPRPMSLRVLSKKDITPPSFYLQFTMQCFLPDAPTAPDGRPAVPRAASSAHEGPDAQNAADTGHGILRPSSGRSRSTGSTVFSHQKDPLSVYFQLLL